MSCLYVVEPGAVVRRRGQRLLVEKEGAQLLEVEWQALTSVIVLSAVTVTSPALCALLDAGIELAYMTPQGRLLGQLTPPLARNLALRSRGRSRGGSRKYTLYEKND